MKKLIFIFILFASRSFAQTTLTSANNPAPGDADVYTICDTANSSPGNSGANQTWSFINVIPVDSATENFVAPSSTPYAAQFPGSNIAVTSDSFEYSYATTSSNNFIINGNGSPEGIIQYSDPWIYLQYPFTYNSSLTDNFSANFISGGEKSFMTGSATATGDAWGTISLPTGTFPNSLRVKYVTVVKDSTESGSVFITSNTSYIWFVTGRKFPVFEISFVSITVSGFPFVNGKTVTYRSRGTSGISNLSSKTPDNYTLSQNYPNPFNPVTNLEFGISKLEFVSLKIYDMLGKEVASLVNENLNPGTYKYNFDGSKLTSGVYFYKLEAGDYTEVKKMTLLK